MKERYKKEKKAYLERTTAAREAYLEEKKKVAIEQARKRARSGGATFGSVFWGSGNQTKPKSNINDLVWGSQQTKKQPQSRLFDIGGGFGQTIRPQSKKRKKCKRIVI